MYRFFCEYMSSFRWWKKKKAQDIAIAGLYCGCVFSLSRNWQTLFQTGCAIAAHQQAMREQSSFSASLSALFCSVAALICRLLAPPFPSLGFMRQEETPGPSPPQGSFIS